MPVHNKKKSEKLKVKSRTENLSLIRDFVSENALNAGLPESDVENIMLAVDEACTNIIKHAYKMSPDGEISLSIESDDSKFNIVIVDHGRSFDPEKIPLPDLQKYYRERKVGGLGMYLMKSLMDEVRYKTVPGKYNQVLLSKKIRGS